MFPGAGDVRATQVSRFSSLLHLLAIPSLDGPQGANRPLPRQGPQKKSAFAAEYLSDPHSAKASKRKDPFSWSCKISPETRWLGGLFPT